MIQRLLVVINLACHERKSKSLRLYPQGLLMCQQLQSLHKPINIVRLLASIALHICNRYQYAHLNTRHRSAM